MFGYTITFLPSEKTATIDEHQTLLDAADRAGVAINRICGGDGHCGRCKVVIRDGQVWDEPTACLSREEIQRGYVLACKCYPRGDVVVEVPLESRGETKSRLSEADALRFSSTRAMVGDGNIFVHRPISEKRFLTLPHPTLEDNISDLDRLYRELRRAQDIPIMQIGLAQLQQLPHLLRAHDWQVTATLGWRGGTVEVIQLAGGDTAANNLGVAVDVGTTTVVAHLVDLRHPATLGRQATYNSQIRYGEDVIARILFANTREKLAQISASVTNDINNLIAGLVAEAHIALDDITYVLCAGNTTMTHLLLGLDPSHIRLEPYLPAMTTPPVVRAAEVGIRVNPRGLLWCVPSMAG